MKNESDLHEFVELLYPLFLKKLKKEGFVKNSVIRKNATVVAIPEKSNIGKQIEVKLPYDLTSFSVINETGKDLANGDLISIEYCIDIKNAVAVYKN